MSARLDWTDPRAVMTWLGALRVAVDDANGIAIDMLRPHRQRDVGHREHARIHREARERIAALLDHASPGEPEPEEGAPADPSGNGGAGPVH